MKALSKILILSLSIAALWSADKDKPFKPGPASSFKNKQTNADVTIAAKVFESDEETRPVFGKNNPYKYGVLPVLVVIENNTRQSLKLDGMQVEYQAASRTKIEATPAADVKYIAGGQRPKMIGNPIPSGSPLPGRKKNPLASAEIEGRAFAAKMLPPGDSASGFFYFQTGTRPGATLYLNGIKEAGTGKELFYFEVPLDR